MSKWSNFYNYRIGDSYTNYAEKRYEPFIKHLEGFNTYREEGCGIGTISKILLKKYPLIKTSMFDRDPEMLKLTEYNTFGLIKNIFKMDLLKTNMIDKVDCIFSHGVIEHFDDMDINRILARQIESAHKVVHYVPTSGYMKKSFGDERLHSVNHWVREYNPTSYDTFNDNKDLVLIWEQKKGK